MKELLIMACVATSILASTPFTTGFPCPAEDKSWVVFYMEFREAVLTEDRDTLVNMQDGGFQFQVGYGESISIVNYLNKEGWHDLRRLVRAGKVEGQGYTRTIFLGSAEATFTYSDGGWHWSSFSPDGRLSLLD